MNQVFLTVVKSGCNGRNEDNLWSPIILCVIIYESKTIIYSKVVFVVKTGSKMFKNHFTKMLFLSQKFAPITTCSKTF